MVGREKQRKAFYGKRRESIKRKSVSVVPSAGSPATRVQPGEIGEEGLARDDFVSHDNLVKQEHEEFEHHHDDLKERVRRSSISHQAGQVEIDESIKSIHM